MGGPKGGREELPWILRPIGDGKPWPYDKRLRGMGWLGVVLGAILLLFFAFLVWIGAVGPGRGGHMDPLIGVALLVQGPMCIVTGVAALRFVSVRSVARRRALFVLCVALIACSVALCAAFYDADRKFMLIGTFGLILAPPIFEMERKVS